MGAFWPEIDMHFARSAMRIDGSVTEERLRSALIEAAITVTESLSAFWAEKSAQGITALDQTHPDTVDGVSVNTHRWMRAVHCLAAANLAERYRGEDATGAGSQKADLIESPIDDLRRDAFWAIADILGKSRSVIELI